MAALFVQYRPLVASIATRYVQRHSEIDDVVQETFMRALSRLDQLRCPESFVAWLGAIARCVAIDVHRRERRATLAPEFGDWADPTDQFDSTGLDVAWLSKSIREGLRHLSRRDAELLCFVAAVNAGPREVGDRLGISAGAAKVAVHRARQRLRAVMEAGVVDVTGTPRGVRRSAPMDGVLLAS